MIITHNIQVKMLKHIITQVKMLKQSLKKRLKHALNALVRVLAQGNGPA